MASEGDVCMCVRGECGRGGGGGGNGKCNMSIMNERSFPILCKCSHLELNCTLFSIFC